MGFEKRLPQRASCIGVKCSVRGIMYTTDNSRRSTLKRKNGATSMHLLQHPLHAGIDRMHFSALASLLLLCTLRQLCGMEAPHAVCILVTLREPALPLVRVKQVPDLPSGLTAVGVRRPLDEHHSARRDRACGAAQIFVVRSLVRLTVSDTLHNTWAPDWHLR